MPGVAADRAGEGLRVAAVAVLAAAAALAAPEVALATTDTTFGDPLDTVEGIVGGTGGQLAAALAVGAALVGSVLRFNAMQLMGAVGVGVAAGAGTGIVTVNRLSILTPNRRAKLTPLSGTAEVVPVVHRGDPRGFV